MEKPYSNITSCSDVDYDFDFIEEEDQPFAHFAIRKTLTGRKGAGSFHIYRKTMKYLWILAVLGVREQPNLAQNLVTHRH